MKSTRDLNERDTAGQHDSEIERLLVEAGRRPEIPEDDFRLIKAAARAEWSDLVDARRPNWTGAGILSAAAATALAIALGLAWWLPGARSPVAPIELATIETVRGEVYIGGPGGLVPKTGERLEAGVAIETEESDDWAENVTAMRLVAGQSVRLRSGSRARLIAESRIELLEGAVYVDSGSELEDGNAVTIVTSYGIVVDVGTQFEVRVDEDGEAVRVRVRSGSVALTVDEQSHAAGPGEELRLLDDGSLTRSPIEASQVDLDWTLSAAPTIDIEGLPLTVFLTWVANETDWRVSFEDSVLEGAAATIELHGTIEGLRPDEAVGVVLPGSGLGHRLGDGELYIERLPAGSNGM